MKSQDLIRLRKIDAALASREGLNVGEMAKRLKRTPRTIRRYVDVLENLAGPITATQVPHTNGAGHTWLHWYQRGAKARIFTEDTRRCPETE